MATVACPRAALLPAVRVTTCVPATVPAAKPAVTPPGKPDAASVTAPVKPPASVTVIVLVTLPPWSTVTLPGDAESEKPGGTFTVRDTLVVAVSV